MTGHMQVVILSSSLLFGCAEQLGYAPIIDVRNDPYAAVIQRDLQECAQLAEQATSSAAEIAGDVSFSAAIMATIGAAIGAINGAISGNAGSGAIMGGATGAISGAIGAAVGQGLQADANYRHAYQECMRGRGHRVIE